MPRYYYDEAGRQVDVQQIVAQARPALNGEPDPEGVNIINGKRAGSDLRDRYHSHITELLARGFMSQAEYEARAELVMHKDALSEHMLRRLIADLPALPEPPEPTVRETMGNLRALAQGARWPELNGRTRVGVYIGGAAAGVALLIGGIVIASSHKPLPITLLSVAIIVGGFAMFVAAMFLMFTDERVSKELG